MRTPSAPLAVTLAVAAILLSGCAPEPGPSPTAGGGSARTPTATTATPTPTPVALPADCRAILSPEVLAQLTGVPLNDPAIAADAGVQPDGSLRCVWGRTEDARLTTEITRVNRGPALDLLNQLRTDNGFTCFTPDGGTRCEKTWPDAVHPVTDGRTLFWRDGVLIDTRYAGLAPEGYTSAVVAALWG